MSCSDWDDPIHKELACSKWQELLSGNRANLKHKTSLVIPLPKSLSLFALRVEVSTPPGFQGSTLPFQPNSLLLPPYAVRPHKTPCDFLNSLLHFFPWMPWFHFPFPSSSFAIPALVALINLLKMSYPLKPISETNKAKSHLLQKLVSNSPSWWLSAFFLCLYSSNTLHTFLLSYVIKT